MLLLACLGTAGCGTTRWTDTTRTATEQMLVSDAIDRAVSKIDFSVMAGRDVHLDTSYLSEKTVDREYLISTVRQHMLASGCILKDSKDASDFVIELRTGAVGTDRHDLLFGVPALNLPVMSGMPGIPSSTPEIAFARRTDQQGVAKIAVYGYHRESGKPVWQSGADAVASRAQDLWILGAGPIQKGTIYEGSKFAGDDLYIPWAMQKRKKYKPEEIETARVGRKLLFNQPERLVETVNLEKEVTQVVESDKSILESAPIAGETPAPGGYENPAHANDPLARLRDDSWIEPLPSHVAPNSSSPHPVAERPVPLPELPTTTR